MLPARLLLLSGAALLLVGCSQLPTGSARSQVPIPSSTMSLMAMKGMSAGDPILIRAYKKESEMEVWKRGANGRYALLKTYPICRWSGQLGPKIAQGDRQAPEGYYTITPAQMNPNSAYYLSFDTGFPNAYDRSLGRSGGNLMVHGSCSSAGCYAMTDEAIAEIYAISREAFAGGQKAFQFQAYPFRMTAENMAKYRQDQNIAFWRNLKEGSDRFETTHEEPSVTVAGGRYRFNVSPEGEALAARKAAEDEQRIASLAGSTAAVRTLYADGGQHPSFQEMLSGERLDVSRPEALAAPGQDVALNTAAPPIRTAAALPSAAPARSATDAATTGGVAPKERVRRAQPTKLAAPASDHPAVVRPRGTSTRLAAARPMPAPAVQADERPFYARWLGNLFRS
jgi:murein L,D-transpeptidase YafK